MYSTQKNYLPLAILKQYRDKYKLIVCKSARVAGWEMDEKNFSPRGEKNDLKLECNIARARSKIFEYAMCNDWSHFVTLTIDQDKYDRYDLKSYHKALGGFLNDYNYNHDCRIKYLLIPEPHEDGAWHMHGFFNGIPSDALEFNSHGYLDWSAYRKKFGYISLDTVRNPEAAAKYVTKYISKSLSARSEELNAHLFYASKGLERAQIIKKGLLVSPISPDYENEYVKVCWLSRNQLDFAISSILD